MSSSQGQHAVGMWDRDDALADSGHADGETTLGEHTATPQEPQSTQSKPQTIDNRGKSYCKFYGTKNGRSFFSVALLLMGIIFLFT